jgi:hypothetical protein
MDILLPINPSTTTGYPHIAHVALKAHEDLHQALLAFPLPSFASEEFIPDLTSIDDIWTSHSTIQ